MFYGTILGIITIFTGQNLYEGDWYKILLTGVGLDITGICLLISAGKHFNKSISLYNSSLKNVSNKSVQLNLMINSRGLGIRMVF